MEQLRRVAVERRTAIHEFGHFLTAFKYRPIRAISIRIGQQAKTDPITGEDYVCLGEAVTWTPDDSFPRVNVSIRAWD